MRMMKRDVLFIGNLSPISDDFFKEISEDTNCVVFSDKNLNVSKKRNVSVHKKEKNTEQMHALFEVNNFKTVVFFSQTLDGKYTFFDELERLEEILYVCGRHRVTNFIYVTTNALSEDYRKGKETSRTILVKACQRLCEVFAQDESIHIELLRVPYIYSMQATDNTLSGWIEEAIQDKQVVVYGIQGSITDFLCDKDLGNLINRMIDKYETQDFIEMDISGGNLTSYEEIMDMIVEKLPDTKIEYKNQVKYIPLYIKDEIPHEKYGWEATHNIHEDVLSILEKWPYLLKIKLRLHKDRPEELEEKPKKHLWAKKKAERHG